MLGYHGDLTGFKTAISLMWSRQGQICLVTGVLQLGEHQLPTGSTGTPNPEDSLGEHRVGASGRRG